jgi:hypothetical protein
VHGYAYPLWTDRCLSTGLDEAQQGGQRGLRLGAALAPLDVPDDELGGGQGADRAPSRISMSADPPRQLAEADPCVAAPPDQRRRELMRGEPG